MDLDGITALNLFARFPGPNRDDPRRKELIDKLPSLTEEDLTSLDQKDSCCPICFTPFLAVLASEEMALAMESPAPSVEELGVTRLADTCGHLFCRKDITTWIRQHDTCPTCRRPFIVRPTAPREAGDGENAQDIDARRAEFLNEVLFNWDEGNLMIRPSAQRVLSPQENRDSREDSSQIQNASNSEDRDEFVGMYS